MKVREIQASDIAAIFEVRVATWDNEHGAEELEALGITPPAVEQLMASSHRGWLCEVDGQVVGFAMGNSDSGEMWVIAVLEEFENRGIGRRLLAEVEEWLWSDGWNEIWLTTDRDETMRAVGFYRHLGWQDWKLADDRFMRKTKT